MRSVIMRCDASPAIGFGHLFRSLALARELSDREASVSFAMVDDGNARRIVEGEGYDIRVAADIDSRSGFDALVLDVRSTVDSPTGWIDALRSQGIVVADIDDPTDCRLSADLVFYPPVPQIEELDWRSFSGSRFVGAEWIVLRRAFAEAPVRRMREHLTVLVTMGGSDPGGMTATAIDGIARMPEPFDLHVVLGPGFVNRLEIAGWLQRLGRRAMLFEAPSNMRSIMLDADIAVASFGVTAYELAATATPAVYLCLTADHARSASVLEQAGAAIVLGVHTGEEAPRIAGALRTLLSQRERRLEMGRAGRALVDGRGAARVADRIVQEMERRRPSSKRSRT